MFVFSTTMVTKHKKNIQSEERRSAWGFTHWKQNSIMFDFWSLTRMSTAGGSSVELVFVLDWSSMINQSFTQRDCKLRHKITTALYVLRFKFSLKDVKSMAQKCAERSSTKEIKERKNLTLHLDSTNVGHNQYEDSIFCCCAPPLNFAVCSQWKGQKVNLNTFYVQKVSSGSWILP